MNNELSVATCQKKLLELILLIDDSCQELGLSYWIDGGTLLGAVRHGNFIPWDDDLDVCLLYDDFQILVSHLHKICEQSEFLVCFNTVQPPTYSTEKLSDIRILSDGIMPVHIDIILVKAIPSSPDQQQVDKSLTNIAHFFQSGKFKHDDDVLDIHYAYLPQNKSEFLKKKEIFFEFFHHEYLPTCAQQGKEYVYNYAQNDMLVKRDRLYYQHDDIFPLKKISFAGHEFYGPHHTGAYLSKLYGANYLTPPPAHQQKPANSSNRVGTLDKKLVTQRLKLHFAREHQHFIARNSASKWKRMYYKFRSFCQLAFKSMQMKDFQFVFVYLRFTLSAFLK